MWVYVRTYWISSNERVWTDLLLYQYVWNKTFDREVYKTSVNLLGFKIGSEKEAEDIW